MTQNWRPLTVGIGALLLLLALGYGFMLGRSTPAVITQEVTRIVVATATPTPSPIVVEKVVTVTVVTETTPMGAPEETPPSAATATVAGQGLSTEAVAQDEESLAVTSTTEAQLPASVCGLDDPVAGLTTLSEVAQVLQTQGIHTLRLTMVLSVPSEVTVREGQQVDKNLTWLVRNQLSNYDILGDYIVDIGLDGLAQQEWVIEALGGVVGLGSEEVTELRQNGENVWEKPTGGEWSLRKLQEGKSLRPLGDSCVTIDANSHTLNVSDLIIDALRPLLLAADREQTTVEHGCSWTRVEGIHSADTSFLEVQRERAVSSNNNLKAITASLADSGLSTFVDPAAVSNGIQQVMYFEQAGLDPDTWLVNHGRVEVQGKGMIEATYAMQHKWLDAEVTLRVDSVFEYLPVALSVTPPE